MIARPVPLALLLIPLLVFGCDRRGSVGAHATPLCSESPAVGQPARWQLRSQHFVYGMPVPTDDRHMLTVDGRSVPGISVLVREGFVVGHYDAYKVPAWVSMRWTERDYRTSEAEPYGERNWAQDQELPPYARAGTGYDFATSRMERGHMARHEDNKAWGSDNVDAGSRMSNVVPQHEHMNGEAWLDLEEEHRSVVANPASGIRAVWVISGPVFEGGQPMATVGNGVGVPHATYKVVGWFDRSSRFHARGYVVRQEDRVRDPAHYLTPVDEVERLTGLDFFPELEDGLEDRLEAGRHAAIWD
jgi:endonuclease G